MRKFAFTALLCCALTLSTFCVGQETSIRICALLSGQDQSQNTVDRFATILDQKRIPKSGSIVGIPIAETKKTQVYSEVQKQRCEYVIELSWINLQSLELTPSPDVLSPKLIPAASTYAQTYQAFAPAVVRTGSLLGYRLAQPGHKKALFSGMLHPFQPPIGIDAALDRLAELIAVHLAH